MSQTVPKRKKRIHHETDPFHTNTTQLPRASLALVAGWLLPQTCMPQVSGEPAQYVRQKEADKRRMLIVQALWAIGSISAIASFLLGSSLHGITVPPIATFIGSTACLCLASLLSKIAIQEI